MRVFFFYSQPVSPYKGCQNKKSKKRIDHLQATFAIILSKTELTSNEKSFRCYFLKILNLLKDENKHNKHSRTLKNAMDIPNFFLKKALLNSDLKILFLCEPYSFFN
jgi:hypothetical protein